MPEETKPKKSPLTLIVIIVVLVAAAAVVYFLTTGKESETANTNTNANTVVNNALSNANTNTPSNSNPTINTNENTNSAIDLAGYDGKTVNIASTDGKVTGQMAFAYHPTEQMPLQVVYFFKVKDNLPKTKMATNGTGYFYIASHTKSSNVREGDGTGTLDEVLCNHDQMPDVLALARAGSISVDTYGGCPDQYSFTASTDTFYQIYSTYYNQYDFNYDLTTSNDTLVVFDSGPYWRDDPTTGGSSVDDDEVVAQAPVAKQYTLLYSE